MENAPDNTATTIADSANQEEMRMWLSSETASWIYDFANIGLVIGLAIGVISTVLVVWMGNIKEEYLNTGLANSRERTATLEKQSGEAQIAIAGANERAAEAEQKAAEAKLALEKYKAPRFLSQEEQQLIVSKTNKFSGQEYSVTTFWDIEESLDFSNQLHKTLHTAGWQFIPPGKGGSFLLGGMVGIQVFVHPDADPIVKEAANELMEVLEVLGQNPKLKSQSPKSDKSNKIALNVGTKR